MMSLLRIERDTSRAAKPGALFSALTLALSVAGCSADVGRFDFPTFNLNGKSDTTSSLPTPSEPMMSGGSFAQSSNTLSSGGGTYVPPRGRSSSGGVEVAALSEPAAANAPTTHYDARPTFGSQPYQQPRASYQPPPTAPARASTHRATAVAAGGTIEVQRGDTLFALARRNNVTVKDLMAANNLSSPTLRPGQSLRLPGGTATADVSPVSKPAPRTSVAAAAPAASPAESSNETSAPAAAASGDWNGSYKIQAGDSLYRIARQHNVKVAELEKANNITNARQLKPGTTLRVPGAAGSAGATSAPTATAEAAKSEEPVAPRVIQSTTQPTVINNTEQRVAALDTGRATDATAAPAAAAPQANEAKPTKTAAVTPAQVSTGSMRWPSKGKVVSGFGQRPDGTHNDGINISVPQGTDVHAAAEGEVAYAGSELKGYGNLILLRHDNGWVTAYAHADKLLVKRGDKVRRGDVIAKSGNTGQVDQPQLHFELRQGSKPVDPLPYLDRL